MLYSLSASFILWQASSLHDLKCYTEGEIMQCTRIMSLCAGKEYQLSANLIVKAFPTIHPVQSQVMLQSLLSDLTDL